MDEFETWVLREKSKSDEAAGGSKQNDLVFGNIAFSVETSSFGFMLSDFQIHSINRFIIIPRPNRN
jgi:hypothetical protein